MDDTEWGIMDLPDTAVGRRVKQLIALLGAGSPEEIAEFVENSYAPALRDMMATAQHMAMLFESQRQQPAIKLRRLGRASATELEAYCQSTSNHSWVKLCVTVGADSAHQLTSLRFMTLGTAPPAPTKALDSAVLTQGGKHEIAVIIASLLDEHYVHAAVGKQAAGLLLRAMQGATYDDVKTHVAFAERLTADIQNITNDKHVRVSETPWGTQTPRALRRPTLRNAGYEESAVLAGNIGYLALRGFEPIAVAQASAQEALRVIEDTHAVIIDLRINGGGFADGVQYLCSHFFADKRHLNSLYWRAGQRTHEFWTLDTVAGKRRPHVPVFVLTSTRTFSAAEEGSYNLQMQKRATIVGATSAGGANPGEDFDLGPWMSIFISTGMAINPVSKSSWEGVGVRPDVEVDAEQALEMAIELAQVAAETYRKTRSNL